MAFVLFESTANPDYSKAVKFATRKTVARRCFCAMVVIAVSNAFSF